MGLYTQQDPIGIAGGLNLYGYANGDPVNFSDPFGLCPEADRDAAGKCPEPEEGPVNVPPPAPGADGQPNEWVEVAPSSPDGRRKFGPRDRVPHPKGSQPSVSWDPAGHWDRIPGDGTPRKRYLPNGTLVDHDNNPIMESCGAVCGTGVAIGAGYLLYRAFRLLPSAAFPPTLIPNVIIP